MNARKLLSAAKAVEPVFVEELFSTYLYTGTSTADNKITNGIDLAGKGGMVWLKSRTGAYSNYLTTNSTTTSSGGGTTWLYSDTTDALLGATGTGLCNFFSDGFDINPTGVGVNATGNNYVSWTFREQAKFFDVVTYTGNGANRTISHNLGSVPGCIIVKRTDTTADWQVYHRSIANTEYLVLNTTAAKATGATRWNSTTATSTEFSLGTDTTVNANTGTYVAYLFAHDAGGFGASGSDNVITCGSFTTDGSGNATVTLGYEPQWVMIKRSSSIGDWTIVDTMRGLPVKTNSQSPLFPNTSAAEAVNSTNAIFPTATGFVNDATYLGASNTYIYIAIRRGPMKTPTSGTSVFAPATRTGTGTTATVTTTISPVDMLFSTNRDRVASSVNSFWDRLRGGGVYLNSNATSAEASNTSVSGFDVQNGVTMQGGLITNGNSYPYVNWNFRRAPGFFDVVCYTGTGSAQTVAHNLGVVPELVIFKARNDSTRTIWDTYFNFTSTNASRAYLNQANSAVNATYAAFGVWSSQPTASALPVTGELSFSGNNIVAYLFATCPGVSKVFSYTGNGSSQTINCGFTGGARFVLIKRTDSTGDWYVWDSARGIVAGNDPHLSLNSTAAEVTTDDSVDTDSTGFVVNQLAATNVNVNAATYIGLAIA